MKLNPFRPDLVEERTHKANRMRHSWRGVTSLPASRKEYASNVILKYIYENMGIEIIKMTLYPLTRSQGRAGACPSCLQARGGLCPGQVAHCMVDRQTDTVIHTHSGQSPTQTRREQTPLLPLGGSTNKTQDYETLNHRINTQLNICDCKMIHNKQKMLK